SGKLTLPCGVACTGPYVRSPTTRTFWLPASTSNVTPRSTITGRVPHPEIDPGAARSVTPTISVRAPSRVAGGVQRATNVPSPPGVGSEIVPNDAFRSTERAAGATGDVPEPLIRIVAAASRPRTTCGGSKVTE